MVLRQHIVLHHIFNWTDLVPFCLRWQRPSDAHLSWICRFIFLYLSVYGYPDIHIYTSINLSIYLFSFSIFCLNFFISASRMFLSILFFVSLNIPHLAAHCEQEWTAGACLGQTGVPQPRTFKKGQNSKAGAPFIIFRHSI